MTFSQICDEVCGRMNLSSTEARVRVGVAVNRHYKRITSLIGLNATRFVTKSQNTTAATRTVTFTGIEKIDRINDATTASAIRPLEEVSIHYLRRLQPGSGQPSLWAIQSTTSTTVTICLDTAPTAVYALQADGTANLADLTADDEPAFPESHHDVITDAVLEDELIRKEKLELAAFYGSRSRERISDLRFQLADSPTQVNTQAGMGAVRPRFGWE